MPDMTKALAQVQAYHERSKHRLDRYAAGPDTLDWDAQPNPFRRYLGAPLTALPLACEDPAVAWPDLFEPGQVPARPLDLGAIGLLFELSLALAAWKQHGPDRWAVRINPSSCNLHPTEGWLLCQSVPGLPDGVHHYAPREHALEWRGRSGSAQPGRAPRACVALSSIAWREAWKYGERAFSYCLLDAGHAIGALRYAAAVLGWCLQPVAIGSAGLAALLDLDREADFGLAEREQPDVLFEILPVGQAPEAQAPWHWPACTQWHGGANRLDRHPMYRWPVIDEAIAATRRPDTAPVLVGRRPDSPSLATPEAPNEVPAHAEGPPGQTPSATGLIRQRRSAQRFEARARLPLDQLWARLAALQPWRLPFDVGPAQARVHGLLLAHRVDGLTPGAYLLPRSGAGRELLRRELPDTLDMHPVPGAPPTVPLLHLAINPALVGTLRTLNCHQALGSDAILGFALLAQFNPLPDAAAYRERLHEAGLIGQVLYLEAEALGLRGTGIGCFFDDALHGLLGLREADDQAALQSVYHFTLGAPVHDARIGTEPPYAYLERSPA